MQMRRLNPGVRLSLNLPLRGGGGSRPSAAQPKPKFLGGLRGRSGFVVADGVEHAGSPLASVLRTAAALRDARRQGRTLGRKGWQNNVLLTTVVAVRASETSNVMCHCGEEGFVP